MDIKKLAQVSMDGPHVNWKLLDMLGDDRKLQDQHPDFLNVGSCSLHVVHGAFRSGMLKTNWGIDAVLKALYNLFSESPAKREDFIKLKLRPFPCHFVVTDGLRTNKLLRELQRSGLTSQLMSKKFSRNPKAKFQHPALSTQ